MATTVGERVSFAETSSPRRILIVDDNSVDRARIGRMLNDRYDLDEATTGAQALEILAQRPIDCVLLDYQLPDMDGLTVLSRLAGRGEQKRLVPVVMLTIHHDLPVAIQSMRLGAVDYLLKARLTATEVEDALQNAWQKTQYQQTILEQREAYRAFAHAASHDLRGPLRRIKAFAGLLAKDYVPADNSKQLEYLEFLTMETKRLDQLVEKLLEYARSGRGRDSFEVIDLNELMVRIMEELQPQLEESDATIWYEELPTIIADPTGMWQLVVNLLLNAIRYRSDAAPRIEVTVRLTNETHHELCFRDNGRGIPPEQHESIFEPLRRFDVDRPEATGLGLSVCREIARQHDGAVWVQSAIGEGSSFYVTISRSLQASREK